MTYVQLTQRKVFIWIIFFFFILCVNRMGKIHSKNAIKCETTTWIQHGEPDTTNITMAILNFVFFFHKNPSLKIEFSLFFDWTISIIVSSCNNMKSSDWMWRKQLFSLCTPINNGKTMQRRIMFRSLFPFSLCIIRRKHQQQRKKTEIKMKRNTIYDYLAIGNDSYLLIHTFFYRSNHRCFNISFVLTLDLRLLDWMKKKTFKWKTIATIDK